MPDTSLPSPVVGLAVGVRALEAAYGVTAVLRGVDLDVGPGEIVALLGPSGCGKTTLLRCIAGLEDPTAGTITIGDRDVTSGRGVPAENRRVGMVFQDGALFPHRTVLNNVNYGVARGPRREEQARDVLRLVGLDDKRDRLPGTLSGGEQQRVALARALAPQPGVVLLDEPFSSLDAALRVQLRDDVRALLKEVGVTTVLVTHDQQEALTFGDRVAVMNAGQIVQVGEPQAIYATPATPWVAEFVGEAVLLPATFDGGRADTALGTIAVAPQSTARGTVMIRPEQLAVQEGGESTVTAVQYLGTDTRYEVLVPGTHRPVVARMPGAPRHATDSSVTVRFADDCAHAWPEDALVTPR